MKKNCNTCRYGEFGSDHCEICVSAYDGPPSQWKAAHFWEPDTNADRIRAMSDEALAKFICGLADCHAGRCPGETLCNGDGGKCNGALKWLKQPAEVND